jgi:hypothetical protein
MPLSSDAADGALVGCLVCHACSYPVVVSQDDLIVERWADTLKEAVFAYELDLLDMQDVWCYSATNPSGVGVQAPRTLRTLLNPGNEAAVGLVGAELTATLRCGDGSFRCGSTWYERASATSPWRGRRPAPSTRGSPGRRGAWPHVYRVTRIWAGTSNPHRAVMRRTASAARLATTPATPHPPGSRVWAANARAWPRRRRVHRRRKTSLLRASSIRTPRRRRHRRRRHRRRRRRRRRHHRHSPQRMRRTRRSTSRGLS